MENIEKLVQQVEEFLEQEDCEKAEACLIELRRKEPSPELNYIISKLLIKFGIVSKNPKSFNEAIKKLKELDSSDFPKVHFYLGTAYLKKYEILEEKPNYLNDSEKLLQNSKIEFKKHIAANPDGDLHNAYVNLGSSYGKIGRTIESLDIYNHILEEYGSEYGLYNKGYFLYEYSTYSDNPMLCIKKSYECFKIILNNPQLKSIFREKSKNMIDLILERYDKEFLEDAIDENMEIEIPTDSDFEFFMINYAWQNKLTLNFCDFCQNCPKSIEDSLVIEKMIYPAPDENNETSFSKFSSYLNQIKMDYISARLLLILSEYDDIDLDDITKYVFITDTDFQEANGIRVQLLKDSFKNFFNILDKIAFFIKDYLNFENEYNEINFKKVWFEPEIHEKLIEMDNPGISALHDIYLEIEHDDDKKQLRDTRNALTHRYLKITAEKQEVTDKTVEELRKETLEIAHIVKNAIIYLMRFVKINEENKEEELEIEFIPLEEVEL
jgi:hypothetical protein